MMLQHRRKTRRRQQKGGAAKFIGKGSYGCTYKPAFECAPLPPPGPYASPEDVATRNALTRKRRYPGKIAKLTSRQEADKEMRLARTLRRVDPEQSILLYGLDSCPINPTNTRTANGANYIPEIKQCIKDARNPLAPNSPETAVQVFMKYGGSDLLNLDSELAIDAPAVLESLLRLFDGLELLHAKQLVHLDFKLQNAVLRRESGIYKPYIIDFGLIGHTSQIYRRRINWPKHIYPAHPPELGLLDRRLISLAARPSKQVKPAPTTVLKITSISVTDSVSDIIDEFITNYLRTLFATALEDNTTNGIKFLGVPYNVIRKADGTSRIDAEYLAYMRDLANFIFVGPNASEAAADLQTWLSIDYTHLRTWLNRFNGSQREPPPDALDTTTDKVVWRFFDKFLRGVDAYSLGLVLAGVWFQVLGIKTHISPAGLRIMLYDKNSTGVAPDIMNAGNRRFIAEFHTAVIVPFNEIVAGLMNFKFTKRLTISAARARYVELIPILHTWCVKPGYERLLILMKILEDQVPLTYANNV